MWFLWSLAVAAPPGDVAVGVSIGDCARVLDGYTVLDDVDRLAVGWCRRETGDPGGAVGILSSVAEPGLKPWASWIAARFSWSSPRPAP